MKNCIILLTHYMDDDMMTYISYIKKQSEGVMDFYVLFDTNNEDFKLVDESELNVFRFNHADYDKWYFQNQKELMTYLYPVFDFAEKYKYDHYLFLENDMVFNGNFRKFLSVINDEDIDYVHTKHDVLNGEPNKHHPFKFIKNCKFNDIRFSFCNMEYISRPLLYDIKDNIELNDTIFQEFLIPTVAYNNSKYSIRCFEDYGYQFISNWGPASKYEKYYIKNKIDNTFYHPIKNLSLFNNYNKLKNDIEYERMRNHTIYCCYHNEEDRGEECKNTIWFNGKNDELNPYLSEFSMFYWIWKNDKYSQYITTSHYGRRMYENDFDKNLVNDNSCQVYYIFHENYSIDYFFNKLIKNEDLLNDYNEYIYKKYNKKADSKYNSKFMIRYASVTLSREHFMNLCEYLFGFFDFLNDKYNLNYEPENIEKFCDEVTVNGVPSWFQKNRTIAYIMEMMVSIYIQANIEHINEIPCETDEFGRNINVQELKTCIISMFRYEEKYLDEWVEHHLNIGFDRIFILDNNDYKDRLIYNNEKVCVIPYNDVDFSKKTKDNKPWALSYQCDAYNYALCYIKKLGYNYATVIDNDEFFDLMEYKNIKEFIKNEMIRKDKKMTNILYDTYDDNNVIWEKDVKGSVQETFTNIETKFDEFKSCSFTAQKPIFRIYNNTKFIDSNHYVGRKEDAEFNFLPKNILRLKHYRFKSLEEYVKLKCLKNNCCRNEDYRKDIIKFYFKYNNFTLEKLLAFKKILSENNIHFYDKTIKEYMYVYFALSGKYNKK